MKKLLASTMVLALVASTAGATGWGKPSTNNTNKNYNTNTAQGGAGGHGGAGGAGGKGGNASQGQAQGQAQGQHQGQGQSQSATGTAISGSNSNASSNARGGSATNAGNAQNVNVNSNYDAAAYAPDVNVSDCQIGVSAGVPGAVAGVGIPSKHCRVLIEAELIEYYWGKGAAGQHLFDNNPRIRRTVQKQITSQQPVVSKVSTRNRTAKAPTAMRGEDR